MTEKDGLYFAFVIQKGEGIMNKKDGLCYRNVLATYAHIHAYGTVERAEGLMNSASVYHEKILSID